MRRLNYDEPNSRHRDCFSKMCAWLTWMVLRTIRLRSVSAAHPTQLDAGMRQTQIKSVSIFQPAQKPAEKPQTTLVTRLNNHKSVTKTMKRYTHPHYVIQSCHNHILLTYRRWIDSDNYKSQLLLLFFWEISCALCLDDMAWFLFRPYSGAEQKSGHITSA